MRTIKVLLLLSAISLLSAGGSVIAQTANDFLDNYVGPLKIHDTPVLYGECSYRQGNFDGKIMVIFPLGKPVGTFVDFAWNSAASRANPTLVNTGDVTVTSEVELDNMMMGGPGAYQLQTQIVEFLLTNPFKMVYPKDLYSIVASEPKTACQPSP